MASHSWDQSKKPECAVLLYQRDGAKEPLTYWLISRLEIGALHAATAKLIHLSDNPISQQGNNNNTQNTVERSIK